MAAYQGRLVCELDQVPDINVETIESDDFLTPLPPSRLRTSDHLAVAKDFESLRARSGSTSTPFVSRTASQTQPSNDSGFNDETLEISGVNVTSCLFPATQTKLQCSFPKHNTSPTTVSRDVGDFQATGTAVYQQESPMIFSKSSDYFSGENIDKIDEMSHGKILDTASPLQPIMKRVTLANFTSRVRRDSGNETMSDNQSSSAESSICTEHASTRERTNSFKSFPKYSRRKSSTSTIYEDVRLPSADVMLPSKESVIQHTNLTPNFERISLKKPGKRAISPPKMAAEDLFTQLKNDNKSDSFIAPLASFTKPKHPEKQFIRSASCPQFQDLLVPYMPKEPSRLIGRKMGLECVDIVSELKNRSMYGCIDTILSFLSPLDLCRVCQVSKSWRQVCEQTAPAQKRRLRYLQKIEARRFRRGAENIGRRSPRKVSRELTSNNEVLGTVQTAVKPNHVKLETPEVPRHQLFFQEAGKLKCGESLSKCPKCQSPSKIHQVEERGCCTRKSCQFDYCTKCMTGFHGAQPCASMSGKKSKPTSVVGSKKSKKNLKRL